MTVDEVDIAWGDYRAVVASRGAALRTFTFQGRDLVVPSGAGTVALGYSGMTMAPWPNRIVDGRYVFEGVTRQVEITEPERHHALHGFSPKLDFELVDKTETSVTWRAEVGPREGYPWSVVVTSVSVVAADGLTQTVTGWNRGPGRAPWGTGPHPYLVAGPGCVDEWTLSLPADRVLAVTDDRLIPTDLRPVSDEPERCDFREPRAIGDLRIDNAFTALRRDDRGLARVQVRAREVGVEMVFGDSCDWVQIYASDDAATRIGLGVEPMTCAPDAFNTGAGLVVLDEGDLHEASWRIAAL
jgi:aldose 1-epimerase